MYVLSFVLIVVMEKPARHRPQCALTPPLLSPPHMCSDPSPPQPYLLYVLCGLTACVGVLNHYLLPQLRKETPWIWVAHPIIRPKEYGIYEATGTYMRTYMPLVTLR